MKITKSLAIIVTVLAALRAHAQNTIQFNSVTNTEEGAIRLSWASNSNEVYQIQCTDTLIDSNGLTPWQVLYDKYPSHGTNTFWLDTGNYILTPTIVHPKYSPMRFYRILSEGTNDGESPLINISTPTNASTLFGEATISVTTTSSYPFVSVKLFVDGQEMNPSDDGTNFVINTCEWPNGIHTLFATAVAQSRLTGPPGLPDLQIGRSVSPYVPVNFSNLVTKVAFSQMDFQPSLGQTQEVTASFAANVDWTLEMIDQASNAVRTVTGSGTTLVFDWDGTGDGGTNIPDGIYYYQISAETNGGEFSMAMSGSESLSAMSGTSDDTEALWAVSTNGAVFPMAIYPPNAETNDLSIFPASNSTMFAAEGLFSSSDFSSGSGMSAADYSGPDSQSTVAPSRPSTAPIKNTTNSVIIAYYNFPKNLFPSGRDMNIPKNGVNPPLTGVVHLNGNTGSTAGSDYLHNEAEVSQAAFQFRYSGWSVTNIGDDKLSTQAMRRSDLNYNGGELFTQATIGIFMDHGSYGTDPDYSPGASGTLQTYFASGNPSDTGVDKFDNGWLRMCQFGFGGNLKWMAISACNPLCDPNYSDMATHGAIPLKTTHLLCGASTITYTIDGMELEWADKMIKRGQTVADAWINAGKGSYALEPPSSSNAVTFRITGYLECFSDTITSNTPPSSPSPTPRNLNVRTEQVYP